MAGVCAVKESLQSYDLTVKQHPQRLELCDVTAAVFLVDVARKENTPELKAGLPALVQGLEKMMTVDFNRYEMSQRLPKEAVNRWSKLVDSCQMPPPPSTPKIAKRKAPATPGTASTMSGLETNSPARASGMVASSRMKK